MAYTQVNGCCGSNCIVCVPQDQWAVHEKCGAYQGQLKPGMTCLGLDCCGQCITTKAVSSRILENTIKCETKTLDNVFISVEVAIQQTPKTDALLESIYRLRDPLAQIDSYVQDVVRAHVPKMALDEVFSNKDSISHAVMEKIKGKMGEFGWTILQCLVTGVDPDAGVKNAMNAVESANRDRVAAQTRAEAQKFVLVKAAEAEAESKALQGQGIARQRAAIVQGLKDSIGVTGEELDAEKVSELLLITQYFDTLEKMASSRGQVIFVPHTEGEDIAGNMRDGILQAQAGRK